MRKKSTLSVIRAVVLRIPIIRHLFQSVLIHEYITQIEKKIDDYFDLLNSEVSKSTQIQQEMYKKKLLGEILFSKSLNHYENQVFSQNGEDGIIQEIFSRIKTKNNFFVEFGVEDGRETNTTNLLHQKWKGLWLESDQIKSIEAIQNFSFFIQKGILTVINVLVKPNNIERLLKKYKVPREFDLLSIDIDGNDYWVWKAITSYNPRVVAIEYNALFVPPTQWIMKYNSHHVWKLSSYQGASLQSLVNLALQKGYVLVGCDLTGTNSFFVRGDCLDNKFSKKVTIRDHYQSPRYYLRSKLGYPREVGPFENF